MQEIRLIYGKEMEDLVFKINTLLREHPYLTLLETIIREDEEDRIYAFMVFENARIRKNNVVPNAYADVAEDIEKELEEQYGIK